MDTPEPDAPVPPASPEAAAASDEAGSTRAASRTGTPGSGRTSREDTASADSAAPSQPDADTAAPGGEPGWWLNTGLVALDVLPHGLPSAHIEPGRARWLPYDPGYPTLQRCDGPPPEPEQAPAAEQEVKE
jgi:pyruvate/2-oxoglutarate dehydrogenase complex dihydrolipoamide acyltransferase (E2) component